MMMSTPRSGATTKFRLAIRRLARDCSGLALVEFALAFPFLLLLATTGLELANYVITFKRVSEMAVMISDNASRMGAQSVIANKPISEAEINDVFIGADLQGGNMDFAQNGRIILSSLQQNGNGGQTIKWQRCYGNLDVDSEYGAEGVGEHGHSFAGMGPSGNQVTAASGTAVMVVEITYKYTRIMPLIELPLSDIKDVTAFNVRDTRDLTQVYNTENVTASTCT